MQILLAIVSVFALCFILYKASEIFINSVKAIAKNGILSKFLLASIFGGIATSVPEIFIGIASAIEDKPTVAVGNALGSNIANLGLVVPFAVILGGSSLAVHKEDFSARKAFLVLTSSLLPFLLALDGALSRVDGIFLVAMFFVYTVYVFQKRRTGLSGLFSFLRRLNEELHKSDVRRAFGFLFFSLFMLVIASDVLVRVASFISQALHIKMFLIGVFLIAIGTSLPELFVALSALKDGEASILFGDILGSLVTNANLVVGISAAVNPIRFTNITEYNVSVSALFLIFMLFIVFAFTKHMFEKWEAVAMVCGYLLFFLLESMF